MSRTRQLPKDNDERLLVVEVGDFLSTAVYWGLGDTVVVHGFVSGVARTREVVLAASFKVALELRGTSSEALVRGYVQRFVESYQNFNQSGAIGINLRGVLGPEERAVVLTAHLSGHDRAQRFPGKNSVIERTAALYNFSLNFYPTTVNEFLASYEGISVSAVKSRLNRARAAGLLSRREESALLRGDGSAR
jgi:hypothetical protein